MGAGAVAELVIRSLIKLPTDPELVRGMEAQIKLQQEREMDCVEFEAWMEEEKRNIRTGFTGAPCYSSEEWFVLTGKQDGGWDADDLQSEEEEEIKLLKLEGDYLADLDEEDGNEPF